ncbi:MAG: hypothetical protein EPN91_00210 [Salinibacterium sp.]|nr:MAG: hypothetical protein EPN91_00210 [Salinibacterium sp.]
MSEQPQSRAVHLATAGEQSVLAHSEVVAVGRIRTSRPFIVLLACLPGVLLIVNLAILLALRPIVQAQGLPKDIDRYTGVAMSVEAQVYGGLAAAGFVLVVPLVALTTIAGVLAVRLPSLGFRVFGIITICAATVLLFATPWAGLLWLGFGW